MLEQQLKQRAADAPLADPTASLPSVVRRGRWRLIASRMVATASTVAVVAAGAAVLPSVIGDAPVPEVLGVPENLPAPEKKGDVDEVEGPSEDIGVGGTWNEDAGAKATTVVFDVDVAILQPASGTVTEAAEVVVKGEVESGASVTVAGVPAEVTEGSFRAVVPLEVGKNRIKAVARIGEDRWGIDDVIVERQVAEPTQEPKAEPEPEPEAEPKPAPEVTFTAVQSNNHVEHDPPYSYYEGTAPAGAIIKVTSDYGSAKTQAGTDGTWKVKVWFDAAPYGTNTWIVTAWLYGTDQSHSFEFTGTRPKPEATIAFTANQLRGSSDADPPTDVFWGTAHPGSEVWVYSEYGEARTFANEKGDWQVEVAFPTAPVGQPFPVKVKSLHTGERIMFEFERLA